MTWLLLIVPLLALLALGVIAVRFLPLWLQAKASGVPVSILDMWMMRLRLVDPLLVVTCLIALSKAGIRVEVPDLEAHLLSGGNLGAVTEGLIRAQKAGLDMDFRRLAAIDLAGRNVRAAVENRVHPKVLLCPAGGEQGEITGVCQDGVRLGVRMRATVRTDLNRLVGGAGEETIVARIGEGIVAAIGRAASHKDILARPEVISAYLLARGLDSGTCFDILSLDVADVEVKDNIGARLQAVQAETDKKIAQARAEIRRAAAVAVQTEMRAETLASYAAVVSARAAMPFAAAAAFREANVGVRRPLPGMVNSRLRWLWRPER
jgi:uncharacterized protein YqfA (UPF0365 family)